MRWSGETGEELRMAGTVGRARDVLLLLWHWPVCVCVCVDLFPVSGVRPVS